MFACVGVGGGWREREREFIRNSNIARFHHRQRCITHSSFTLHSVSCTRAPAFTHLLSLLPFRLRRHLPRAICPRPYALGPWDSNKRECALARERERQRARERERERERERAREGESEGESEGVIERARARARARARERERERGHGTATSRSPSFHR